MSVQTQIKIDTEIAIKASREKIYSRPLKYYKVAVCDFTNWIRHDLKTIGGKIGEEKLILKLREIGFEKCLRKEANHYALIEYSERNTKTIWLRSL